MSSLDDYRDKRNFRRTPEPPPELPADRAPQPVFVVHRHDARALHFDLRLEVEGVLWSFAVPKGFSYNPRDKKLAVRTEDHPIEYEHFHGVIPKGEYGAGTMTIWDRGTYEWTVEKDPRKAVAKGEIKIILRGRRLRGEWHLVKTKQDPKSWLLFKSKDLWAGPDRDSALGVDLRDAIVGSVPDDGDLAYATDAPDPFDDPDWVFEMLFVGRRLRAAVHGADAFLVGLDATPPTLARELANLRCDDALVDGVVVALDSDGRPSESALEIALGQPIDDPPSTLYFYAFDLLRFDEFDLRQMGLVDRKGALRAIIPPLDHVMFVDHVAGNGHQLATVIRGAKLPGMVAKRANAPYPQGSTDEWRRIRLADDVGVPASDSESTSRASDGVTSRVKITNVSKVYWPAEGYTKGDLLHYYDQIADTILPYLANRPVHMNRYPDGIEGKAFYQRHANETTPPWVTRVRIHSDSKDEEQDYILCTDRDTLLCLINQGSIDLHPWMSPHYDFEHPDYAVLDLDPKTAPFDHVIEIARVAGELMHDIGLRPLLKTSGKTGLHITIPLISGYTYEHVRMFLEGVARAIVRELPAISTVERVVGQREGKVYLDFLQNGKGQTVVPPYVARPVRGATVSTPLAWDELTDDLRPSRFNILTVPRRVDEVGDLFQSLFTDRQHLLPAIEALSERIKNLRD